MQCKSIPTGEMIGNGGRWSCNCGYSGFQYNQFYQSRFSPSPSRSGASGSSDCLSSLGFWSSKRLFTGRISAFHATLFYRVFGNVEAQLDFKLLSVDIHFDQNVTV